ncbi:hypothetical protein [Phenylobacterium sp.]|jgi:hypothetical protein|uniref:hypothetical protein n=1 Tax=Phenylobacterium sp. TaxID=1871053 RepID=UPI0037CAA20A
MPALAAQKIVIVGHLVESSPDRVLSSLSKALAETVDDSALGDVRKLVETEVTERQFRNAVMEPLTPMFVGGGSDTRKLTFPLAALVLIWRGLRRVAGAELAEIRELAKADPPHPGLSARYDQMVATVASGLQARSDPDFAAAAELCDQARPDGAKTLLACMSIAAVVRRAVAKLPIWISHPGSGSSAPARLAYNDAMVVSASAGQNYFEMIAAQLDQRWMVLRIISAVMEKPTEHYLSDSKLAGFAEAVMDEVDEALTMIATFDPEAGPEVGHATAIRAELAVRQLMEIETNVALNRDRGWGRRVHKQRRNLASVVEARLRDADVAAMTSLPMHEINQHGVRRTAPRLSCEPDAACVRRAETLLSFSAGLRSAVNYGGFSAARGALVEKLSAVLDLYVEEAVQQIRLGQADETAFAGAFLDVAARFSHLVAGEKAGELVRRRAQAARHQEPQIAVNAE